MFRVEVHPAEGGDDAAEFARQLASAIAKHFTAGAVTAGRIPALECP